MSLDESTSKLIGSIYDSVHDHDVWLNVLDSLLTRTNSRFALVSAVDLGSTQYRDTFWRGPDDARFLDAVRDYEAEIFRDDPTLAFARRHPFARSVGMRDVLRKGGRDPATDPFARWVRSQLGASDTLVCYTPPTNGLTLGLSLHAPAAGDGHDRRSVDLFLLLFEHIERAFRLALRPPDLASETRAVAMLAPDGRMLCASEAAWALFAGRDGLTTDGGRLAAASRGETRRLDAAITSALGALSDGGAGGALALPRPSGRPDLLLRIDPLPNPPSPFEAFRPAALVMVTEPDETVAPQATRRWAQSFGLTPAETRLTAALLADDASLRTVADRLGIAYATARVQLASVFDKVGVGSQAQLTRLLTRLGIWVAALWPAINQAAAMLA